MVSRIFTFGLLAGSVYFFYQHSYIVGVLLLVGALLRLFRHNLQQFAKRLGDIAKYSELERNSNCIVQFSIDVEEILKHASVAVLFEKLRAKGVLKGEITKDAWLATLLQNYKHKYKRADSVEEVKFNIKNNLLWKNGAIDFNDSIYHEVFIPYDKDADEESRSFLTHKIDVGLTIRVFLVNGIIKLQIGEFSKGTSPDVVKNGLAVYKRHETITSFPLLYFSYRHKLPEHYLSLSMYATDAYSEHLKGEKTGMTRDWKEIVKDVADYNYVCSVADEYVEDSRGWDKIVKRFDAKREEWLKREDFRDPYARNEDDDYYDNFRDDSIYYVNTYLTVSVANYNNGKERWERYVLPDYYAERP